MKARIRKPQHILLIYGLNNEEQQKLNEECAKNGIICKRVEDTHTSLKVGQLLSNDALPEAENLPLEGKFALMSGFDEESRESCMHIINGITQGVIKAVATEHNVKWKFYNLAKAISEEHNYMMKNQKKQS